MKKSNPKKRHEKIKNCENDEKKLNQFQAMGGKDGREIMKLQQEGSKMEKGARLRAIPFFGKNLEKIQIQIPRRLT